MSGLINAIIIGMIEGGLIGGIMIFYLRYRSSKIDPTVALAQKPANLVSFSTVVAPEEAMQTIVEYARNAGLDVYNIDPTLSRVILGENVRMTGFHNGYWLPVYITRHSTGTTTIEVGIKPKIVSSAALTLYHNKAVNGIKTALQECTANILLRASQTPDPATHDLLRPTSPLSQSEAIQLLRPGPVEKEDNPC